MKKLLTQQQNIEKEMLTLSKQKPIPIEEIKHLNNNLMEICKQLKQTKMWTASQHLRID